MPAAPHFVSPGEIGSDGAHLLDAPPPAAPLPLPNRIKAVLGGLTELEGTLADLDAELRRGEQRLDLTNRECATAEAKRDTILEEIEQRQAELARYERNVQAIAESSAGAVAALRALPEMRGLVRNLFPGIEDGHEEHDGTLSPDAAAAVEAVRRITRTMLVVSDEVDRRALWLRELGHQVNLTEGHLDELRRAQDAAQRAVESAEVTAEGLGDEVAVLHADMEATADSLVQANAMLVLSERRFSRRANRSSRRGAGAGSPRAKEEQDMRRDRDGRRVRGERDSLRVFRETDGAREELDGIRAAVTAAQAELDLVLGVVGETYQQQVEKKAQVAKEAAVLEQLEQERRRSGREAAKARAAAAAEADNLANAVRLSAAEEARLSELRAAVAAAEAELASKQRAIANADVELTATLEMTDQAIREGAEVTALAWRQSEAIIRDAEQAADAITEGARTQADRLTSEAVIARRAELEPVVAELRAEYARLHEMVLERVDALGHLEQVLGAAMAEHGLADADRGHLQKAMSELAAAREAMEREFCQERANADRVQDALREFVRTTVESALRDLMSLRAASETAKTQATETVTTMARSKRLVEAGTHFVLLLCGGAVLAIDAIPVIREYIPSGGAVTAVLATALVYAVVWGVKSRAALKATETPLRLAEATMQHFFTDLDRLLDECRNAIGQNLFLAQPSGVIAPSGWTSRLLSWIRPK